MAAEIERQSRFGEEYINRKWVGRPAQQSRKRLSGSVIERGMLRSQQVAALCLHTTVANTGNLRRIPQASRQGETIRSEGDINYLYSFTGTD